MRTCRVRASLEEATLSSPKGEEVTEDGTYTYEEGRDGKRTKEKTYSSVVYQEFGFLISYYINIGFNQYEYSKEHKGYVSKYYDDYSAKSIKLPSVD